MSSLWSCTRLVSGAGGAIALASQMPCHRTMCLAAVPDKAFEMTKRELRAPYLKRFDAVRAAVDSEALEEWCAPQTLAGIRNYLDRTVKRKDG